MPDPSKHAFEDTSNARPASAAPTEGEMHAHRDPYAAFGFAAYRYFSIGNFTSVIGRQMLAVAVGYEIYQRTHSATALGLIGLCGALPVTLLAIPAGHVADRFSRRSVLLISQILTVFCSLCLAWVSFAGARIPALHPLVLADGALARLASVFETKPGAHFDDPGVPLIFALLFLSASARSFGWAARGALLPSLVPPRAFANAVTWNANFFQAASVTGPALGGLLIARFGFPFVYAVDAVCALAFFLLLLPIHAPARHDHTLSRGLHDLFSGVRFVWRTKLILATITLDLFAVLLGGATALLPIFADEILRVGPTGLGWMRAAPAIGAVTMGVLMAWLPPMRRAGVTMLWAVAGFGAATIVFGVSKNFWLSMAMLALTGAFDNVSVVVRHTLIQLITPDPMRGRVAAVNNVFIGSSNELGAFESGLTAALWGPVASVVLGGVGTIAVVAAVIARWPQVLRLKTLAAIKPDESSGKS